MSIQRRSRTGWAFLVVLGMVGCSSADEDLGPAEEPGVDAGQVGAITCSSVETEQELAHDVVEFAFVESVDGFAATWATQEEEAEAVRFVASRGGGLGPVVEIDAQVGRNQTVVEGPDGHGILYVTGNGEDQELRFVDVPTGAVFAQSSVAVTRLQGLDDTTMVHNGTEYAAGYLLPTDGALQLYTLSFSPFGYVGERRRVTRSNTDNRVPSLVWTGSGYSALWLAAEGTESAVPFLTRLDDKAARTGADQALAEPGVPRAHLSVGWHESKLATAWEADEMVVFAVWQVDGTPFAEAAEIAAGLRPTVRPRGDGWVVAWVGTDGLVNIQNFDHQGAALDDAHAVAGTQVGRQGPGLAVSDAATWVAWLDGDERLKVVGTDCVL